jgi:hypothetical protein
MKMIFSKSTGEHAYLDVYVRLCSVLFKKFNDKENNEMNFKKLLVTKCQKQFMKMLNAERKERKKRRDSMMSLEDGLKPEVDGNKSADEQEFTKPMMYLYDEEELKERLKEQMYGNMFLITELFIGNLLSGGIIKMCLEELQQEINDQNVEIMCYMITKLMTHLVKNARKAIKDDKLTVHGDKSKVISLDYAERVCLHLFEHRKNEALTPRIRFKIQDVIDGYNKEWNFVITDFRNKTSDNDGFQQIYVPKD